MMQELNYIRCGDYYIPDIRLPEENRPIGRWGRMHRDYIKEHNPIRFNDLCLSGELWTYLADMNEQAQNRLKFIIEQMKASEDVTERMKQHDQMAWVGAINSIRNRAEECQHHKRGRFSRKGTRRCNLTYWRWAWDEAKHKSKRNIL